MVPKSKLGITSAFELGQTEERIAKPCALGFFESGLLDTFGVSTFACTSKLRLRGL